MKWIQFFSSLDGRIARKTFWLMSAATIAAEFIAVLVAGLLAGDWIIDIVVIAFLYPQFVIDVKRGHDRNIPLWVIGAFWTAAAVRYLLLRTGWLVRLPNQNVFSAINVTSFAVTMLLGIVAFAILVELGFRRGTPGPNQFGPDPLANP